MSQFDVATGRGDVVRSRHRTIWRPAPFTVRAAGYLLLADASITIAAAVAVAGPAVLSRLTGLEMVPGASAQAPMVWEIALPSVIGAALGLAFAAAEIGCGLLLRRVLWWNRFVVSGLAAVGFGLALVPGAIGMAFHFSGWAGTLPGVKHLMLAAALLLVWLPAASREFFRRPAATDSPAATPAADATSPSGATSSDGTSSTRETTALSAPAAPATSTTPAEPNGPIEPSRPAGRGEVTSRESGQPNQKVPAPTESTPAGPIHREADRPTPMLPGHSPQTADSHQPTDDRELTG